MERIWDCLLLLQWIAGTKCSMELQYRERAMDLSPSWSFWMACRTSSFWKEGTGINKCKLLQLSIAYVCVQSHAWRHMWVRHEHKRTNTCVRVLSHSHTIHYSWSSSVGTHMHKHICLVFQFPYCFQKALCTWHVLHIHKRVGEELSKGNPSIWISL